MSQDKIQKIKDTIQQAWNDGDKNSKDKFGDFLNRAAIEINQLFVIPELTDVEINHILEYIRKSDGQCILCNSIEKKLQAELSLIEKELGLSK